MKSNSLNKLTFFMLAGKTYPSTVEEAKRKEIWLATRKMVMEHNKRAENGSESFTMGINYFSDMVRWYQLFLVK